MASYIGQIESVEGKFFAKAADGSVRELAVGDKILEGETVFGDKSNAWDMGLVLKMENGEELGFMGQDAQSFDASVTQELAFSPTETVSKTDSIATLLEESGDIDETNIDELDTAAGEEDGGA